MIGVADRIEIWSMAKWEDFRDIAEDSFEDIAEDMIDFGL